MPKEPRTHGTVTSKKPEPTQASDGRRRVFGTPRRNATPAEWDAVEVLHFISRVVESGDAVTFSRSQDGGVVSVTVLHSPNRTAFYPHSGDEAVELFTGVLADLYG